MAAEATDAEHRHEDVERGSITLTGAVTMASGRGCLKFEMPGGHRALEHPLLGEVSLRRRKTMKKLLFAALAGGVVLAAPANAQEPQHQHRSEQGPGMMMGHGADMEKHREAMQEMRELMQRARAATDPAERERLMAEHREKMQAHMAGMMSGENARMMQEHHQRMAMMHEMMAQMAAQHAAMQDDGSED